MRTKTGPVDRLIAELALKQHGVVAIWQLLGLALSRSAVTRRIDAGRLHPVYRGVYAVGHKRLTMEGRFMAAVLACGEGAPLSHRSAGAHWRIAPVPSGPVEVTVVCRGRKRRGIRVRRTRHLAKADAAIRDRIPVTSVPRTLVDLGTRLNERQRTDAFRAAEGRGLLDRAALVACCERLPGRRGTGTLRRLLSVPSMPLSETRSRLEERFLRFCAARGLPTPAVNVPLGDFEVDCLWPEHRVAVELDSWGHHGDREAFERDRARDAAIQRMDHRIIRVTARRLKESDELEADLRDLLELATTRPGGS